MIPLREQEAIRQKFAMELTGRVRIDYFTERESALTVPGRRPCENCKPARLMMQELASLHDAISLRIHYFDDARDERAEFGIERIPSMVLRGRGESLIKLYGLPGGTLFPAFIESLVAISRDEVLLSQDSVKTLRKLKEDESLRVFVLPACPYSPQMAYLAGQISMASPNVRAEVIVVSDFPELAERYKVRAVPLTLIEDRVVVTGAVDETMLVEQLLKAVETPLAGPASVSGPTTPLVMEEGPPKRRGERASGLVVP